MKKIKDKIIFTDRYGGNYPTLATMCKGDCEGMGIVPIHRRDLQLLNKEDEYYLREWDKAEAKNPSEDGYHFVTCNECKGTGKQP